MGLAKEEKLEQLEKILQSRALHSSESLKSFLRFVVLKSLNNEDSYLKEYTIASEVFGQNNYDPRIDSVVRVQASRLRSKLHEYYATEGKSDRVVIDLPKGHYAPTFSSPRLTDSNETAPPANAPGPPAPSNSIGAVHSAATSPDINVTVPPADYVAVPSPPRPPGGGRLKQTAIALGAVAVLLAATTIYYRAQAKKMPPAEEAPSRGPLKSKEVSLLWGGFFRAPQPTLIAFSNTLFERRPDLTLKSVRLSTQLDERQVGSASSPWPPSASQPPNSDAGIDVVDYYTGVGEVMGVSALTNLFTKAEHPFRVKRSLLLNWDDVKTENIIILGSPAENLFLRKLPQSQDFAFRFNSELRVIELVNLKPRPGETEIFRPHIERVKGEGPATVQITEDYALVSMIKGLGDQNRLLILAGITTHGTQAAAEYVTKPEYVKELVARVNSSADAQNPALPDFFQVLVKVKINGGVPVQISYVTHHVL